MFNVKCLFSQPLCDALHGLLAVLMLAEGGEADVSFAGWAETNSWCADYAGSVEHLLEEFPTWRVVWSLHPKVGGVLAAVNPQTELPRGSCRNSSSRGRSWWAWRSPRSLRRGRLSLRPWWL